MGVGALKTLWSDADEELRGSLLDAARDAAAPGGGMTVLPFTQLDNAAHYFIRAKRPNEKGEVPLGGAY